MAATPGLKLGLVALEQPAEAAYAFVVYGEALGEELTSLSEGADIALLHPFFESVQGLLGDALGSAIGLLDLQ